MPVYNVAPFLNDCIRSIITQIEQRADIELILLDDKSTDGSAELCRDIVSKHERHMRLLQNSENRGISAARNTMLENAQGEYLWFVDSDDMLLPGAIDSLLAITDAMSPDIVLCDYMREGNVLHATFPGPKNRLLSDPQDLIAGVFTKRRLHIILRSHGFITDPTRIVSWRASTRPNLVSTVAATTIWRRR